MWALVKFTKDPSPVLFGLQNSGYCRHLSTMQGVEWVQMVTSTGWAGVRGDGATDRLTPPLYPVKDAVDVQPDAQYAK